jgi:hypothetical protein
VKKRDLARRRLEAQKYPELAVRFVITLKCPKFRYTTMRKNLVKRGVHAPVDGAVLEELLIASKATKPMVGDECHFL